MRALLDAEPCPGRRCSSATMNANPTPAWHQPVMGLEALQHLEPASGATVVDGTVGTAGHSLMILPRLLPSGRLIAIDRDHDALALARQRLAEFEPQVTFVRGNYRDLPKMLAELRIPRVNGLFDRAVSGTVRA